MAHLALVKRKNTEKYFRDLDHHKKPFRAIVESERELIDMAFNKKKADDRKEWLKNYEVCVSYFRRINTK